MAPARRREAPAAAGRVSRVTAMGRVRVGIGGWVFAPWRRHFYPPGLPQARELEHASRALAAIEINATFHGPQRPESFRRWREATPDGFVFALKGPRWITHRRDLGETAAGVARFLDTGVMELGDRLGPILWQFAATRRYEPEAMATFLAALPRAHGGQAVRHAVEVAHASFADKRFVGQLRDAGVALALIEAPAAVMLADVTADFVYARLKASIATQKLGYPKAALDRWAARFRAMAGGLPAPDLPCADPDRAPRPQAHDAFVFFIGGAKQQNPAAAMALQGRLDAPCGGDRA
ncbi:MAG TPA: DUF72 domain-containing protein [Acetobacteraceae bacterium]|nr:DUF72 domain-containing protein [Acetobacteraceae bacterium]